MFPHFSNYVIVQVVAVLHGKRDLKKALGERAE